MEDSIEIFFFFGSVKGESAIENRRLVLDTAHGVKSYFNESGVVDNDNEVESNYRDCVGFSVCTQLSIQTIEFKSRTFV
jgi:hypothetical protein